MDRRWLTVLLGVLVPVALVVGLFLGGHPDTLPTFARNAVVSDNEAQVFQQAIDQVSSDFYLPEKKDALLDRALSGAVDGLDKFSQYYAPEDYQAFEDDTEGQFAGIGVTVAENDDGLRITSIIPKGPAEAAGLRMGDEIVSVNGKILADVPDGQDKTTDIRGKAGTKVTLTIERDGTRMTKTLTRATVSVPVVDQRMETTPDGTKVGYVSLSQFTSGAHGIVSEDVRALLDRGAKGIVFDLRHDGGGLLEEGVLVASVFIPDGLIVSTKGRNRAEHKFNASGDAIDTKIPLVVLVDGATASASEIVTGALQDDKRATVVGTRTYGKGVFQEVEELPNGGAMKITVGEYFTPSGRNLAARNGKPGGITPDVEASDDPATPKTDEALQKGLEVLEGKL
jgi:carboxyl-terminal processing protease